MGNNKNDKGYIENPTHIETKVDAIEPKTKATMPDDATTPIKDESAKMDRIIGLILDFLTVAIICYMALTS